MKSPILAKAWTLLGWSPLALAANPLVATTATTAATNPYGLAALWRQGDGVAQLAILMLVLMSLGTWFLVFYKVWQHHQLRRHLAQAQRTFLQSTTVAQASADLPPDNAYQGLLQSGIQSQQAPSPMHRQLSPQDVLNLKLQTAMTRLQRDMQWGQTFLATTATTSPFVGLFGTVWGIYHALVQIGVSGQASLDKIAGPVGEALVMTALGLAVAVPAALAYNSLVRHNNTLKEDIEQFATELFAVLSQPKQP